MSNILKVAFKGQTSIKARPLYQYDYGQVLKFVDLTLPEAYEVHFSNYERGTSTTTVATSNEVNIPDTYLQTGRSIYVWLYLHTGNNDGETEYHIEIPVIERAAISNDTPTPVEEDTISQTIAALNSAASSISTNTAIATQAALDAEQYRNVTRVYMENTQRYVGQIEDAIGNGYITLGNTRLTEQQLIQLLQLIE